jgi:hypothetical protein
MAQRSTKENSIFGGEFMDIPNGNCGWLSWSNRTPLGPFVISAIRSLEDAVLNKLNL